MPHPPHPKVFTADTDYTALGVFPLTFDERMENRLILQEVTEHNKEARRTNRALYLSHTKYIFIPIKREDGSSIGILHPRHARDVEKMTPADIVVFDAYYNLGEVAWLAYADAVSNAKRRRKILAFLGAIDY